MDRDQFMGVMEMRLASRLSEDVDGRTKTDRLMHLASVYLASEFRDGTEWADRVLRLAEEAA